MTEEKYREHKTVKNLQLVYTWAKNKRNAAEIMASGAESGEGKARWSAEADCMEEVCAVIGRLADDGSVSRKIKEIFADKPNS